MSEKAVLKTLREHTDFLVTMHVNPDTDAVTSALVMAMFLKSLGKNVTVVNEDAVPEWLSFFPKTEWVKEARNVSSQPWQVVVTLDCGDYERVGKVRDLVPADTKIVNIDHHITNIGFGHVNLVKPAASSTAEVLYGLLEEGGFQWNRDAALLVYAGIMTDTGSFRYECTSAYTHQVVSNLMKFKISVSELYRKIYDTVPRHDLKFLTKVFNSVELANEERVAYVTLTRRLQKQFSNGFDLREKVFNFLRSVVGLEVIVIFTEVKPAVTKVNFRSCGSFDVARLAQVYGGGGHPKASGCTVDDSLTHVKDMVLNEITRGL